MLEITLNLEEIKDKLEKFENLSLLENDIVFANLSKLLKRDYTSREFALQDEGIVD